MQTNSRNIGFVFLISLFLSGVIGGLVGATYPSWSQSLPSYIRKYLPTDSSAINGTRVVTKEENAVTTVVDKTSPAVVSIVAKTSDFDPATGPITNQQGIGTGFI